MAFDARKAGLLDRESPDSQSAMLGQEILRLVNGQDTLGKSVSQIAQQVEALRQVIAQGKRFICHTATLAAASADQRVSLVPEETLSEGQRVYLTGFLMVLAGEEAWAGGTGTAIYLVDSGTDEIYRLASIQVSQLQPGNLLTPDADGVQVEAEMARFLGTREGKGVDIFADGTFAQGSDLVATVWGYIE